MSIPILSVRDENGDFVPINAIKGDNGKSAYQTWLDLGNTGTEAEFIVYLQGEGGSGTGDMLKSTYDTDNDGVVNDSDKLGGVAASGYAREISGQTEVASFALDDYLAMYDTSAETSKKGSVETLFYKLFGQGNTYLAASARGNIASMDSLQTIIGKLMKWYADFKTVVFSGSYTDLIDKPVAGTDFQAPITTPTWTTPTLLNAATQYDSTNNPVGYSIDALGWVSLKGLIAGISSNASIFTLPVGYRPLKTVYFFTRDESGTVMKHGYISSSGAVYLYATSYTSYIVLDGIRFPTY